MRTPLRCPRSSHAIAALLTLGAPFLAHGDDPCATANSEAKALVKHLRESVPPGSRPGTFRATARKDAVGSTESYRITYALDGRILTALALQRSEEYPVVEASPSADARRLAFYFHSGGSRCCICEYEIQADTKGFVLTRTK